MVFILLNQGLFVFRLYGAEWIIQSQLKISGSIPPDYIYDFLLRNQGMVSLRPS